MTFLILALASYRVLRLLQRDTILFKPREWAYSKLPPLGWWMDLLTCVWCLGFWVSLAWFLAWQAWPEPTRLVAIPFAISTVVGLIASNLDR